MTEMWKPKDFWVPDEEEEVKSCMLMVTVPEFNI
jgi:hypothetical protein